MQKVQRSLPASFWSCNVESHPTVAFVRLFWRHVDHHEQDTSSTGASTPSYGAGRVVQHPGTFQQKRPVAAKACNRW